MKGLPPTASRMASKTFWELLRAGGDVTVEATEALGTLKRSEAARVPSV